MWGAPNYPFSRDICRRWRKATVNARSGAEEASYSRLQAISSAAAGVIVGFAAGAFSVLIHGLWPLGLLIAFLVWRVPMTYRVDRRLLRLRRWWAMPVFAIASGVAATWVPEAWALGVLVASIFGWVLWFVVYAIFELLVDPGGRHESGWR